MKAVELKEKTAKELKVLLSELQRQQFKLRLLKASGDMDKTHTVKELRRDIARVETILTAKEGKADE